MLIIRGVNVFPSEIERVLLKINGLFPNYQIHLTKKGSLDSVELHLEIEKQLYQEVGEDLGHSIIQNLNLQIQHQMKSNCLVTMDTIIHKPGSLPRSEGKAKRVVDRRNPLPIA